MSDPSSPSPNAAPPPTGRWLRVLLFVSLAANLAVAGLVVGAWVGHDRDGGRPDREMRRGSLDALGMTPYVGALDPEDRRDIGRAFIADAEGRRNRRQDLSESFRALTEALRADPFDRAAAEREIERQRSAISEVQALGTRLLFDRLEAMSPDERHAYADRLEAQIRRRPRRD